MMSGRLTRKQFLIRGGAAVGGLSLASLAAACGGGGSGEIDQAAPATTGGASTTAQATTAQATTTATGEPTRGGRLRIGMPGGGSAETLDPNKPNFTLDDARNYALYEGLTKLKQDGSGYDLNLAAELEPNGDGTVWTARLHEDVVFHDGKPLTADDVIYSYRFILDEANGAYGRNLISPFIDPEGFRKIDDLTVEIGLLLPYFYLPYSLAEQRVRVFPEGSTTFDPPIGTGPWKFDSWTPGQRSLFVRNENYRIHGGPYLDELEYISVNEPSARVNGLQAGQLDAISEIDTAAIGTIEADSNLAPLRGLNAGGLRFILNCEKKPFDDVRVRQAFRLMVDRQQILDNALVGEGMLGNDLEAPLDPAFLTSATQREYDPEQAKALLKQAGHEGLEIELQTGNVGAGVLEMATLYAEQAKAAGVTMTLKNWPPDQYWSVYEKYALSCTDWAGRPLVPQFFMSTLSIAPFNEPNWINPQFDKLVFAAIAEPDEAKRLELLQAPQQLLWDEGAYVIPVFKNNVDALSTKVVGVTPSVYRPLGGFEFNDTYFA